jgi:hypothetical protein
MIVRSIWKVKYIVDCIASVDRWNVEQEGEKRTADSSDLIRSGFCLFPVGALRLAFPFPFSSVFTSPSISS